METGIRRWTEMPYGQKNRSGAKVVVSTGWRSDGTGEVVRQNDEQLGFGALLTMNIANQVKTSPSPEPVGFRRQRVATDGLRGQRLPILITGRIPLFSNGPRCGGSRATVPGIAFRQ